MPPVEREPNALIELTDVDPGIVCFHVKRAGAETRTVRVHSMHPLSKSIDAYCECQNLDKNNYVFLRELKATDTGYSPVLVNGAVLHAHVL